MHRAALVSFVGFMLLLSCGGGKGPYDTDPVPPEAAHESLHLAEGFRTELYAAEPHVVDPVEMCFDERGGVYVAEMLDYPFDPGEGKQPRSRIRYLIDSDNDGRVDDAVIFADHLLQATSVFPWKGGIFVAAAPEILYLKDTNGDHVADEREVWYTGFDTNVSPEARITNFRFGLDNWIYCANNGRPGKITSPKFPGHEPVYIRGFDFRFNPVTGEAAPAAGPTQFGMSFDAWGNRFVTQNTVHLRHAVIPARYALRNPFYSPPSMLHYVPGDDPRNSIVYPLTKPQQWRVERTALRQERYDETRPGREELVGGHFTAATGTTVYLGDAWGEDYYGSVLVADANGSLVHREVFFDDGPTFRTEPRPQGGPELLASTDVWFRPVNMANAPDGALYVMDFYREYIEEPASIPEAIKQRLQLNFYRGDDRGRIWRIVRENGTPRELSVDLSAVDTAGLVALLGHPNGWHRRTAQRLLIERADEGASEGLANLATNAERPEARLHALWTQHGLGLLKPEQVSQALQDPHSGVRANAVRLAEFFLPELDSAVLALGEDPDPTVRFQVSLTLGELESNEHALARTAEQEADDLWFRRALLTGVGNRASAVLERLLTAHRAFFRTADESEGPKEFVRELAALIGTQAEQDQLTRLVRALRNEPELRNTAWRSAVLDGLSSGLAVSGKRSFRVSGAEALFAQLVDDPDTEVRTAALAAAQYFDLPKLLGGALADAANEGLSDERRAGAVGLLAGGELGRVAPVIEQVLSKTADPALHLAALSVLEVFSDSESARITLSGWPGYGPAARERAVALLISSREGVLALLDAVESDRVPPGSIDAVAKIKLGQHPIPEVRDRAAKLFAASSEERAAVVARYRDVLNLDGRANRGKDAFEKACAKCHRPQGERARLGPDLSGVNNKTREELLTHILDPSFEVAANYTNYIITTKDGRFFDGLLAGETAASVTLRGEYSDPVVRRAEIDELRASTVSLMPEGLEEDLTREELADVIAYLRAGL